MFNFSRTLEILFQEVHCVIYYCHTRLHPGFSAKLRIWQVPACKMESRSGIFFLQYTHPPIHPPIHPPAKYLESCKFQLARWSHKVVLFPERTSHPPTHPPYGFFLLNILHSESWSVLTIYAGCLRVVFHLKSYISSVALPAKLVSAL